MQVALSMIGMARHIPTSIHRSPCVIFDPGCKRDRKMYALIPCYISGFGMLHDSFNESMLNKLWLNTMYEAIWWPEMTD